MKRSPKLGGLLIVFLVLAGVVLTLSSTLPVRGLGQPTPTVAPATPASTQTSELQSGDSLQKTYQQVLEASTRAVEEVHKTADAILTLVGVIFVALTIGGVGGAWLLSDLGKRASDKASAAEQNASEALDAIKNTAKKTAELEKRNGVALQVTNDLTTKQNILRAQMEGAEGLLRELQIQLAQIRSSNEKDRQVLKKPLALVQIDDYGMQILSGSSSEKDTAISALIEMSTRTDAVIRRRSAKTLGVLEEYDERVVTRLKEMAASDSAQGVRKEAEKSLKAILAKKPKRRR